MNDHPLRTDPDREARIRARAYRLWEEEGRPHGRDVEFWERARELEAIETCSPAMPPNPVAEPRSPVVEDADPVVDADLQADPGVSHGPTESGTKAPPPRRGGARSAPRKKREPR